MNKKVGTSRRLLQCLCIISPAALALVLLLKMHVNMLFWDEWNVLLRFALYAQDRSLYALSILWEPHFDHRLVLLKLASLLNFIVFDGQQLPMLLLSFLLQLCLLLRLISWIEVSLPRFSRSWFQVSFCLSCICFSTALTLCWVWPICFQQIATALFYCLAVLELGNKPSKSNLRRLLLYSVLCSLSSGNGILVWPVLVVVSIAISRSVTFTLQVFGFSCVFLGVYFYGLPLSSEGTQAANVFEFIAYILAFLGSPFSFGLSPLAIILGLIGVILFALAGYRMGAIRSERGIIELALALLTLGSAIAGARYRIGLGGIEQAMVSRYIPLTLPFWIGTLLAFWRSRNTTSGRFPIVTGCILVLAIVAPLFNSDTQDPSAFKNAKLSLVRNSFHAVEQGVYITSSKNPYISLYPDPSAVIGWLATMRELGWSVFKDRSQLLGVSKPHRKICKGCDPVGKLLSIDDPLKNFTACSKNLHNGITVTGVLHNKNIANVLLINEAGNIVGSGERTLPYFAEQTWSFFNGRSGYMWIGFIRGYRAKLESDSRRIRAVAVDQLSDRLIPLVGELSVPVSLESCSGLE